MKHWLAKIAGWTFFVVQAAAQVTSQAPRGLSGWLQTIGALIAAAGIHAASSTDGKS